VSGRRRSGADRRPTRPRSRSAEAQLALVKQARAALPTLPTESLYRIRDLLERVLAGPELEAEAWAELRDALESRAR
jgi:hypothetical protein